MTFNMTEFLELSDEDYLEYWVEKQLPHPGCPVSFKLLIHGVHYLNNTQPVMGGRVLKAWKELKNVVTYLRDEFVDGVGYVILYWPLKDKELKVPIDESAYYPSVHRLSTDLNSELRGPSCSQDS